MRALVDEILKIPPRGNGDAPLFTTRRGKPYNDALGRCNAFDSPWQRFMDKAMKDTAVTERFQERDLRAKVASESLRNCYLCSRNNPLPMRQEMTHRCMARPEGFEPPTTWFVARYSIQLSYGRVN